MKLVQVLDLQSSHVKEAIVEDGERVGTGLSHTTTSPQHLVHIFFVDKMNPLLMMCWIEAVVSIRVSAVVSLARIFKDRIRLERIIVNYVGGQDAMPVERPVEVGIIGRQISNVTCELNSVARSGLFLVYEYPRVTLNQNILLSCFFRKCLIRKKASFE